MFIPWESTTDSGDHFEVTGTMPGSGTISNRHSTRRILFHMTISPIAEY